MIRERVSLIMKVHLLVDVGVTAGSFVTAYLLRKWMARFFPLVPLMPLSDYVPLLLAILPVWAALLSINKAYLSQRGKSRAALIWTIVKTNLEGLSLLSLVFFVFKLHVFNRSLVFAFVSVCALALIAEKIALLRFLQYVRKQGRNIKQVLIMGTDPSVQMLVKTINEHPETGFVVRGFLTSLPQEVGLKLYGYPVLGRYQDLYQALHQEIIDEVVFATPIFALHTIKPLLELCEQMGINCRIALDTSNYASQFNMFVDDILDIPLISFSYRGGKYYSLGLKRAIDIVASAVLLVALAPALALIALAIKRDSPGPALFTQVRSGLNGRKFLMYKFRTMMDGAEALRADLKTRNEVSGPIFKIHDDPRITPLGKWLRRSSLDELPQLYNVLKGEMSLVGPRPLPLVESCRIEGRERRRLSMKPGITGIWQCHGRSHAQYDRLIRMDLEYVDNWSLLMDIKLLIKTVPVVVKCVGAM